MNSKLEQDSIMGMRQGGNHNST